MRCCRAPASWGPPGPWPPTWLPGATKRRPCAVAATRRFYRALDAWGGAATLLASTVTRPAAVKDEERKRDDAAAARDAANAEARNAVASLARHARIRITRRHLQALDEAAAWLAAHPDAPTLPQDAGPALAKRKLAADTAEHDAQVGPPGRTTPSSWPA